MFNVATIDDRNGPTPTALCRIATSHLNLEDSLHLQASTGLQELLQELFLERRVVRVLVGENAQLKVVRRATPEGSVYVRVCVHSLRTNEYAANLGGSAGEVRERQAYLHEKKRGVSRPVDALHEPATRPS